MDTLENVWSERLSSCVSTANSKQVLYDVVQQICNLLSAEKVEKLTK